MRIFEIEEYEGLQVLTMENCFKDLKMQILT